MRGSHSSSEQAVARIVAVTVAHAATFVHRPLVIPKLAPIVVRHSRSPHGEVVSGTRIQAVFRFGLALLSPDIAAPPSDAPEEVRAVLAGTRGISLYPFRWSDKTVAVLALVS